MTYDQWKTTDPREYEREEEEQQSELEAAYDEQRRLLLRIAELELENAGLVLALRIRGVTP